MSHYAVAGYQVPPSNVLAVLFSKYTGVAVPASAIVKAAFELQADYRSRGYTNISISIAPDKITNGLVTFHVFRAPSGDILWSGKRTPCPSDVVLHPLAAAKTNASPERRFEVAAYEIRGDTLLSTETLTAILTKYTGTNVALTNVIQAASDLQQEYRNRGYPTVRVTIPAQTNTNHVISFQVFEGRLSDIVVTKNRYYSSNNIIRALPSLRTNTILNGFAFQAELDRANANQDRTIYPLLSPGPVENTTLLTLEAKDRLPLHGKLELNNQNSPGTPDLRVNGSAVYNNLWQLEHSLGVQYSFSPEAYKSGSQWNFYDRPEVANYGMFYRLPLGGPEAVTDLITSQPSVFGYDEASHQFRLPPPGRSPELNVYASRSTIDTGLLNVYSENLYTTNGRSLDRYDLQQDLTINSSIGARLSYPLPGTRTFQSGLSGGLDFKIFDLTSHKTNLFVTTDYQLDPQSDPSHPRIIPTYYTNYTPVPTTHRILDYMPLALRYDGNLRDARGSTSFGLGLSFNPWFSGSEQNLRSLTHSARSSGNWVVVTPSLGRDVLFHTNWVLSLRADGQWANEPLISNEQFGIGGLAGVRGYHEGEVYGDTGWRITAEQKTPWHTIGTVYRGHPLLVRGSVYMDYGEAYLLDPQGRAGRTPLWGVGFGSVFSIGANWETRFLFSWPLLTTPNTEAGQPRFDFAVTAQF